ncbi:GntR family transcriptional regulator [Kribbella sp. NPDC050124]|uniref:GntR family transcriptional regulator n=1 Tax=Kribbella sp. NPDC050124 TaxID=3364114 RepID=UPI0037AA6C0B
MTRRDAVLTELRNAVLTGQLRPGERLPEVRLARDLGVSRPTVREAIYQLIHEGLLVQEDHKGVTVATIDEATITDIAIVRTALESLAAKSIAADEDGAARARLREAWEVYDQAALSGDPALENEAHLELHRTIWAASGNVILQRIWPIVSAPINLALSTDVVVRHDQERSRRTHRELVEAILDNRQRDVTSAVRRHIQRSAAELLELLQARDSEQTS